MKKIFIFNLAIIVILTVALASCSNNKEDGGNNVIDTDIGETNNTNDDVSTEQKEILHKQKYEPSEALEAEDNFAKCVEELQARKNNKKEKLDIPVYYEKELFVGASHISWFGQDIRSVMLNSNPLSTGAFLASYPTSAIRINNFGFPYSVHDTETGYRAFTFFEEPYTLELVGFMIVIKDVLPYSDFLELSLGDPIEKVEEIDPVTSLYKRQFVDGWKMTPEKAAKSAELKKPLASVHYLKEGLLKIEYGMPEDGKLVITKIEFNKDRIMKDFLGNDINYTIDELDLPA